MVPSAFSVSHLTGKWIIWISLQRWVMRTTNGWWSCFPVRAPYWNCKRKRCWVYNFISMKRPIVPCSKRWKTRSAPKATALPNSGTPCWEHKSRDSANYILSASHGWTVHRKQLLTRCSVRVTYLLFTVLREPERQRLLSKRFTKRYTGNHKCLSVRKATRLSTGFVRNW